MGKKNRQYDHEERFTRCKICDGEIVIEHFMERGEVVSCEECESEYILKSLKPIILTLLEEDDDYDDDYFDEDDYFNQGYD